MGKNYPTQSPLPDEAGDSEQKIIVRNSSSEFSSSNSAEGGINSPKLVLVFDEDEMEGSNCIVVAEMKK